MQTGRHSSATHCLAESSTNLPTEPFQSENRALLCSHREAREPQSVWGSVDPQRRKKENSVSFWSQWIAVIWSSANFSPSCRMQSQLWENQQPDLLVNTFPSQSFCFPSSTWQYKHVSSSASHFSSPNRGDISASPLLGTWLKCPFQ